MKPWRKSNEAPKERPNLRIVAKVPASAAPGSDAAPSYRLIFGFLGLGAAVIGLIIYFSPGNPWRWESVGGTFSALESTYRNRGLEKFLQQKAQLKRSVTDSLSREKDPAQLELATNIAVYLFPDALPEDNFEKVVAEDSWGESQLNIEKHPHTAESRVLFEALRADIWNYELTDKEDPKLSPPARQVIQIYDAISAP